MEKTMKTTRLIPFLIATGFLVACGSGTNDPAGSSPVETASSSLSEEASVSSAEPSSTEEVSSSEESSSIEETSSPEESTSEDDPFLTVAEAKEAEIGAPVSVKASIVSFTSSGFYAKDETGYIFVYTDQSGIDLSEYKVDDRLQIDGYGSVYNFSHQISSVKNEAEELFPVVLTKLEEAAPVETEFASTTIAEALDHDNLDVTYYATPVKVRGYVFYSGEYNQPYGIQDDAGDALLLSRYATLTFGETSLSSFENLYVEVCGFVYCYTSNAFVLTVDSCAALTASEVSDLEAVNAAAHYLENELDGTTTMEDYPLPSEYLGASIAYESAIPGILDGTGHYSAPSEPTQVDFTASITRGDQNKSVSFSITALVVSSPKVVLSEIYTAGGNSGATYNCDFVELYNQTNEDIDLSSYSLQNCATGDKSVFSVHTLSGTIKAHDYFLIRGAINTNAAATCATIEDYDLALDKFNPGAKDYMLALANNQTAVVLDRSVTPVVIASANVVDFLGAGKAPVYEREKCTVPDNAKSLQRIDPEVDTDNNKADFVAETPTPRKSSAQ